ncbi:glycosyltransferase family 39 protein [Dactylosporangium aurantiacum]|uniref:Glycosyltransferase family 39 protein n=1 Tax=Dactylosporangium aurantiacum TaxID=35754 RepID=A0A9Q9IEU3_9ACTN|nr:glycosyltransferase family 39 protein [Dactylosporangium aurantiacum]MDG6103368.1 glycosyltransferase family 39 protein [Dactylosporangium aurantiacum]UWZ52114.1 glycosyltransferase family 39 protein [Dactylosporangium aurantiacum]
MTAVLEIERSPVRAPVADPPKPSRWAVHRKSLAVLTPLLLLAGLVNGWNLHGWPGRINDDEGTYVNQAWAMLDHGGLSHYTYWYDHPFLGWAIIAGYAGLTDGFDRAPSAVMVGREVMLIAALVSCALLFLLARRLRLNRAWSGVAVFLFAVSPLAVFFHRMVFLDNLATMFILAALAAAASPRRSVGAALWSAIWFASAALCKETIVILLPALVWLLVQHTDRRTRVWNLGVFFVAFGVLVASYPVFALLKNELLPGEGHVSLGWALWWQVFGRSGSGSLLDPSSGTFSLARSWTDLDPWLLLGGAALIPAALAVRHLRPIGLALLIQVAMMCRGGYLPFAYVIALLPFAALLIAGSGDWLWARLSSRVRLPSLAVASVLAALLVLPGWVTTLRDQATVDGSANSRAATRWVIDNIGRDAVVVTDDYIWMDLKLAGFTNPVWLWKVDTDPAVMRDVLPAGAASIDYIVMADQAVSTLADLPTLRQGVVSSTEVARFGEIIVRRVHA